VGINENGTRIAHFKIVANYGHALLGELIAVL
jgi:hypothetical protein